MNREVNSQRGGWPVWRVQSGTYDDGRSRVEVQPVEQKTADDRQVQTEEPPLRVCCHREDVAGALSGLDESHNTHRAALLRV